MKYVYLIYFVSCLFSVSLFSQEENSHGYFLVSDFEDLTLEPDSFWNGSDESGGFTSGPAWFANDYNPEWMAWSGFSYSNMADDTTPGYMNQFSAITATGFDPLSSGGPNYGVAYVPTNWMTSQPIPITLQVQHAGAGAVMGFYVTNSTQAALSMENGDDYAKKFGGESGDDPDWFMLTILGFKDGTTTGSVDFYLADYRFPNNEDDYILKTWEWVDLVLLGEVDSLQIALYSSDTGIYGMNTPAYFCLDNLTFESGPYISEVVEYLPAPGQLINSTPWGTPSSASSIIGTLYGNLSLGAFGGYVVFRFAGPVENHPDNPYGVDFTIFGNASQSWTEPAVVWVMKDENANGVPDEIWYELAGSDHYFSTSIQDYTVTYSNPGQASAADVPWSDNQGGAGVIRAVAGHDQPYYPAPDSFPAVGQENYMLQGTLITAVIDSTLPAFIESHHRAFGFADNHPRGTAPYAIPDNPYTGELENGGGDAFDLAWAVDAQGNYVDLDEVHFIKIQTAVQADGGWLGELSTEVTGAVDVEPDPNFTGPTMMIVIKDLPGVLTTTNYQMEVFAFQAGRLQAGKEIIWTTNMPEASVDMENVLTVTKSGELEITATLVEDPEVNATVSTTVDLSSSIFDPGRSGLRNLMYPNPASSVIYIKGLREGRVSIYDISGARMFDELYYVEGQSMDVESLAKGMYVVRIVSDDDVTMLKFIKK